MNIKYLLIFTFLITSSVKSQFINFTDANFKAALLLADSNNGIAFDLNGYGMTIDSNADNEIQLSEAQNVYRLVIMGRNIINLSGIEHFTNLVELNCAYNSLTSLDVSNLSELLTFRCDRNQLTSLNIGALAKIRVLYCGENFISNLDLTSALLLVELGCNNNQISNLSINFLNNLRFLWCDNNFMTNIDIANLTNLRNIWFANNLFISIDLTKQVFITSLHLNDNLFLKNINLKNGQTFNYQNLSIYNMNFSNCPNLESICVDNVNVTSFQDKVNSYGYTNCVVGSNCQLLSNQIIDFSDNFSIYPNPVQNLLNISNPENIDIKYISIYNIFGQELATTSKVNNFGVLDVSGLSTGCYFLRITTDSKHSSIKFFKS